MCSSKILLCVLENKITNKLMFDKSELKWIKSRPYGTFSDGWITFFVGILSFMNSASRHRTFQGAWIFKKPIPGILLWNTTKVCIFTYYSLWTHCRIMGQFMTFKNVWTTPINNTCLIDICEQSFQYSSMHVAFSIRFKALLCGRVPGKSSASALAQTHVFIGAYEIVSAASTVM